MKQLIPLIQLYCGETRQNYELIGIIYNNEKPMLYMSSDWTEGRAVPFCANEFAGANLMIASDYNETYNLVEEDGTLNFEYKNEKEFTFENADGSAIIFPATI